MKEIIVIDDEEKILRILSSTFGNEYKIATFSSPTNAFKYIIEGHGDVIISDIKMPEMSGTELLKKLKKKNIRIPIILITAFGSLNEATQAIKEGAFEYIEKPFSITTLKSMIEKALKLKDKAKHRLPIEMIGKSQPMKKLFERIRKIAKVSTSVLIMGETGTGKELVAYNIHKYSPRAREPFVAINCSAIPSELLESELFGFSKGAFTGAIKDKKGKFEMAHRGTLFLDEIGDMPYNLQSKLLRVLENKTIERLGDNKPRKVDVRMIFATNKNLKKLIDKGLFRIDLYYRINVFDIKTPPLRKHPEDIPDLVKYFVSLYSKEHNIAKKIFSKEALEILMKYSWPGNIRELRNLVERVMIIADEDIVSIETIFDLLDDISFNKLTREREISEKELIIKVLNETGWNQSKAAKILGIGRFALRYRMKKFGLYKKNF